MIVLSFFSLGQASARLADLVSLSCDIVLDEFIGDVAGVRKCVELLYGGKVRITEANIQTLLKFSAKFEVDAMWNICFEWVNSNFTPDHLCLIINSGLMLEHISEKKSELILYLCSEYICEEVGDRLFSLSEGWGLDNAMIRFFIQSDMLEYTLPILTAWIQTDANIRVVLDYVEEKFLEEELVKQDGVFEDLLMRMSDKVELLETSKRLLKLRATSGVRPCDKKELRGLLEKGYYLTLPASQIRCVEGGLEHYEYVELLVEWVIQNKPSQEDFTLLWSKIRQVELSYYYMWYVRNTVKKSRQKGQPSPEVPRLDASEYSYHAAFWGLNSGTPRFSSSQFLALINKEVVQLTFTCDACKDSSTTLLRLDDTIPCYEPHDNAHCSVQHWFINWVNGSVSCNFSLVTNSYTDAVNMIRKCVQDNIVLGIYCLYKCKKRC